MHQSDEPRDFEYRVKDGGANYELRFYGWDDVFMSLDSARLGEPFVPRPAPP